MSLIKRDHENGLVQLSRTMPLGNFVTKLSKKWLKDPNYIQYVTEDRVRQQLDDYFRHKSFTGDKVYTCEWSSARNTTPEGKLYIDYLQSDPNRYEIPGKMIPKFYLYSFYLTMVEYFMCNMNFEIQFTATYEDFYHNNDTFILDPIPLDNETDTFGSIILYDVFHQFEILTAMTVIKDETYFSFLYLFDWKVWLCLIISCFLISYFWQITSDSKISFYRGITDTVRTITVQSSNSSRLWRRLRKDKTISPIVWLSLQILLYMWLMMALVVSKSLSGLLLESYLPAQSVPIVNGLIDLVNHREIAIEDSDRLEHILDDDKEEVRKNAKILSNRMTKNKNKKKRSLGKDDHELIRNVALGRSVLLCETVRCNELRIQYPTKELVSAEQRLSRNFYLFFVNKNVKKKSQILNFVKRGLELGLHEHLRIVERMRIILKSNTIIEKNLTDPEPDKVADKVPDKVNVDKDGLNDGNVDKDDSDDDKVEFVITLQDIMRGILLVGLIGHCLSLAVFAAEFFVFYCLTVRFSKDGVDLKPLKTYKLNEIRLDTKRYETIVLTFRREKTIQAKPRRVHRLLHNNYNLYFN